MQTVIDRPITLDMIEQAIRYQKRRKIQNYFPETGPYRRELYAKHIEVFEAGAKYSERLFIAANKVGKTQGGAFETAQHASGNYPSWWKGARFKEPIQGWIANTTWDTVRDVNQLELIGPPAQESEWGTGMIPGDSIVDIQRNAHVRNGILLIQVRYRDSKSEVSELQFKNYEQGRESFQGTNKHWIWADEEVPQPIYEEMLLRTMVCGGHILMTYTPILGMTPLTQGFIEGQSVA